MNNKMSILSNKKGFTFIEILAVMFILSFLVLLAAPFMFEKEREAQIAEVSRQVKIYESNINVKVIEDRKFLEKGTLEKVSKNELVNFSDGEAYYTNSSEPTHNLEELDYYILNQDYQDTETELEGLFVLNPKIMKVFYVGQI